MKSCIENIKIGDLIGFSIYDGGIEGNLYSRIIDENYKEYPVIDKKLRLNGDLKYITVGSNVKNFGFTTGLLSYKYPFPYFLDITKYDNILKIIK